MLSYELIIGIGIFAIGLYALMRDYKFFIYMLLFSSVLIHKELFSLHMWDLMPVRFLMLALSVYVLVSFAVNLFKFFKARNSGTDITQVSSRLKSYVTDPFILSFSLLWLIRGVSIAFSLDIRSSIELFVFFTSIYLAGLFIYIRLKSSPQQILNYLDFYVVLVFLLCMFGFLQLYMYKYHDFTMGAFWAVPGHIPRLGSLFWDVNHFGAFISSLFLYGCARVLSVEKLTSKVAFGLMLLPVPVILYLTNSRSSMLLLGTAGMTFGFITLYRLLGRKAVILTLATIFVFGIASFYMYSMDNSKVREVVRKNFHYRIDSFDSHFLLLSGASEIFADKPILGGGYGSFYAQFLKTQISSEYLRRDPAGLLTKVPAHTIWGEVAAETGVLGLSAFLFLCLIITVVPLYNFFTASSYKEYLIHGAIFSSIIGYFVAGIFYSYNSEFFWLVVFLYTTYGIGRLLYNSSMNINVQTFNFDLLKRAIIYIEDRLSIGFVLLGLLALVLIFANLGKNALITWDESIYGKIAKNMVLTGDWVSLHWKIGQSWLEKPPLYFWSTAFFMKAFGINEFAVRLTSALAGFGTVMAVTYFAKKVYGRSVGYLAGFVLLTTFQFLYYARTGMLDVTLTFFTTVALIIYFLGRRNFKTFLFSGIFVGLAVLTKGVIGFLPLIIIFVYDLAVLEKSKKLHAVVNVLLVFVIAAFVFVPWHAYMFGLYGEKFYKNYILYHVLQRASTAIEDKGAPFWWYIVVMKVSMRMWFIALLGALPFVTAVLVARKKLEKIGILLSNKEFHALILVVIWFVVIFSFFSVSVSKLIWYIMPAYVPAAILVAFTIITVIRAFFTKVSKKYASELVFIATFLLFIVGFSYFFIERSRVYTEDYNMNQRAILILANKNFPDKRVLINQIDSPVVMFYRDGSYTEVSKLRIENELDNYIDPVFFVTNTKNYKYLADNFAGIQKVEVLGEYVLAYYLPE